MGKELESQKVEVVEEELKAKKPEVAMSFEVGEDGEVKKPQEKKETPNYATQDDVRSLKKQFDGISMVLRKLSEQREPQRVSHEESKSQIQGKESQDPYDSMVEKDWKQAVRGLAREEARAMREVERKEEQVRQETEKKNQLLEKNKQQVMERHPELDDVDSEKRQVYQKVIEEHPEYLDNPFGPVLAMRDMEDRLRENGKLDVDSQKAVQKEIDRRARVSASSSAPVSKSSNSNKIILTKDEKEFCDLKGLNYEEYVKFKKQAEVGNIVSVEA